jgi:hypothetical protein
MSEKDWFQVNGEWRNKSMTADELANAIVVKFNLQTDEDVENWIENELGKLRHEMAVEDEMALLDDVDNVVGLMEEYPDAEYMLAKLKRDYLE